VTRNQITAINATTTVTLRLTKVGKIKLQMIIIMVVHTTTILVIMVN